MKLCGQIRSRLIRHGSLNHLKNTRYRIISKIEAGVALCIEVSLEKYRKYCHVNDNVNVLYDMVYKEKIDFKGLAIT